MSEKEIDDILARYWAGESSLEEEAVLKQYFAQSDLPAEHFRYRPLFGFYAKESIRQMAEPVRKFESSDFEPQQPITRSHSFSRSHSLTHSFFIMAIAATFALLISLSIFFTPKQQDQDHIVLTADTYEDPDKAYQEARKALLLISAKLNAGNKFQQELRPIRRVSEIFYPQKQATP